MAPTNRGTVVPKSALPRVLEMPKVVPAKLGAMSMKEEKKPGEMAPLKKNPMQIWEMWEGVIVPKRTSKKTLIHKCTNSSLLYSFIRATFLAWKYDILNESPLVEGAST